LKKDKVSKNKMK